MSTEQLDLDLAHHFIEIGRPERALEQLEVASGAELEDPRLLVASGSRTDRTRGARPGREGRARGP